jgi:ribonuclease HII
MEKLKIREIEEMLFNDNETDTSFIDILKNDERKGVQQLLKKWHNQKIAEKNTYEKFIEMSNYEKKYWKQGYQHLAGIDEAGRGPLAGPVVAAAVILPPDFYLPGLDDSKKLSENKREQYFAAIQSGALDVGVGIIQADEIDTINIFEAAKKAMLTALVGLTIKPDFLLIDALKLNAPYPQESIVKGDSKSISIAAASIIAKVTRDRIMKQIGEEYPQYGFSRHMGYGTKEHMKAIEEYGITPYHRKSFGPIKEASG